MGSELEFLKILIIEDDDMLGAEIRSLQHPAILFSFLTPAQVSASQGSFSDRDILVVGVDTSGGLDLVADLCSRQDMPPVIALAGRGAHGKSLEHILLLSELRGAALSLPKPIDGVELALAAIELAGSRSTASDLAHVAKDLESRLQW
jgi:DNA-binding response OmpR family regulator